MRSKLSSSTNGSLPNFTLSHAPNEYYTPGALDLSNEKPSSYNPLIAISGNNIYTLWEDSNTKFKNIDVYFKKSTDGGFKFGDATRIINSTNKPLSQTLQVATSGKNLYLAWAAENANGHTDTMFMRSTDNGTTFDKPINLSSKDSNGGTNIVFPSAIYAAGNNIYITLDSDKIENTTLVHSDLLFKKSTDGGSTFGNTVRLIGSTGLTYPKIVLSNQLATSGKNVYIAWVKYDDVLDNSTLFLTKSTDGGSTFDVSKNVAENADSIQLATSANNVYVLWEVPKLSEDGNDTFPTHSELLFKKSTDNKGMQLRGGPGFVNIAIGIRPC